MDRLNNATRRFVNTDYRRKCRKEKPQRMAKIRIYTTDNIGSSMRLTCRNEKESG